MAAKYAWLEAAMQELRRERAVPRTALREAACRWPGSLRELQRVPPEAYRARGRIARAHAEAGPDAYATWRARGGAAICLWSELHALHRDHLHWAAWRATAAGSVRRDLRAFLRDLTLRDPDRRAAWPAGDEGLGGAVGPVSIASSVEPWLARRAGLELPQLRAILFGSSSDCAAARRPGMVTP